MRSFDAQTTILVAAVGWLMVYAGMAKRQLKLRRPPVCRHCGLRHAPGNCVQER